MRQTNPDTFAVALKTQRERLCLTQTQLGALLSDLDGAPTPQRTVQKWESGERTPPGYAQKLILQKLQNTN